MSTNTTWAACALAAAMLAPVGAMAAAPAPPKPAGCAPSGGLSYICGVPQGEDLVQIPGTKWVIVSGLGEGNSLKLIDAERKSVRPWYPAADAEAPQFNKTAYPGCPGPPDAKRFFAHGLSLRPAAGGRHTLYMVNHNAREAIEVFEVTPGPTPGIRWTGCVIMPKGEPANSVAATPDGTILATVLNLPGTDHGDIHAGKRTGLVLEWSPKTKAWRRVPNTNLSGNNGIDTSPDGKTFYVVALGAQQVLAYDRTDEKKPPRIAQLKDFWPDNVRLDGQGRLLTAGGSNPCIDAQKKVLPDSAPCEKNYYVAAVDPRTMTSRVLAKGPLTSVFTGPTIAIPVGKELWIGTYQSDRIAYLPVGK